MNKGRNKTEGKEKIRQPFHIKDFPHHHPLKTLFRASLELSFKVLPWLSTWEGRTPAGLPVYLAPISPTWECIPRTEPLEGPTLASHKHGVPAWCGKQIATNQTNSAHLRKELLKN